VERQPEVIADRAYALATCPARAPVLGRERLPAKWLGTQGKWSTWAQQSAPLEHSSIASPDAQRGQWWLDLPNSRVVVQVTHNPDAVLAELRELVEYPNSVALEVVRYSRAQLNECPVLLAAEGVPPEYSERTTLLLNFIRESRTQSVGLLPPRRGTDRPPECARLRPRR